MKIKKIAALTLACIIASSTVAYADAPDGVDNLIVETAAPEVESTEIEPVEEPADMQEAAPTFDDLDQSEEADVSDENAADYITDESVDIDFHSESISTEELVGAVSVFVSVHVFPPSYDTESVAAGFVPVPYLATLMETTAVAYPSILYAGDTNDPPAFTLR